jgi:sugar lactone lactonase YvrE
VDILQPRIFRLDVASGERKTVPMPEPIGCIALRMRGGLIAGLRSGFAFVDFSSGRVDYLTDPEREQPDNRFNDGKCDAQGRFWAGTMDFDGERATGALYRLDPDLSVHRMDAGYVITNGPAFSPDGGTLYHNDTVNRTVYAFDLNPATGEIDHKRPLIQLAEDEGYADGLTVDREGYLWLAQFGAGRVSRFSPAGGLDRLVSLPVLNVTSCCFGGRDLDRLYITSARSELTEAALAKQPLAGGLFQVDIGIRGLAPGKFAG